MRRVKRNPGAQLRSFADVPATSAPRSSFDLSHPVKTTFDSGLLIPLDVFEVLPGDTHIVRLTGLVRLATPIKPVMDNMWLTIHYWHCPNRTLWDKFVRQMGEQANPGDSIDFTTPVVNATTGWPELSLGDYFGIPTKVNGIIANALPFRMYNKIWNEHYRDQDLQQSVPFTTNDGPDSFGDYNVLSRGKRHDYFTAAAPTPQKGPTVPLPLGTTAPVKGLGASGSSGATAGTAYYESDGTLRTFTNVFDANLATGRFVAEQSTTNANLPNVYADLSTAAGSSVTELRSAITIQQFQERDMRGGTRYPEHVLAHYQTVVPDFRVQRAEYLGGGTVPINITQVPQTQATQTDPPSPQGNLSAYGTANPSGIGFSKSFTEHGFVMCIAQVRADLTYQQGLHKMWRRTTRFDYAYPIFAGLSEQAILNEEIFAQGAANRDADAAAFGYTGRYDEYRYGHAKITGRFRSNAAQSLHTWHLSQNFSALPVLNDSFIKDAPPVDRIVAVPSEPQFIMDAWFQHTGVRPLPVYGVPGVSRI